jgi:hypothetical protein
MEEARDALLWAWHMSIFAVMPMFAILGIQEYTILSDSASTVSRYCLLLIVLTLILWIVFFRLDYVAAKQKWNADKVWDRIAKTRTLAVSVLLVHTLLGFLFFVYIVPRTR